MKVIPINYNLMDQVHSGWLEFFKDNENLLPKELIMEENPDVFPPKKLIFNAFGRDPDDIKVVIIGQDCYHGPGQAMGLAFSVPKGVEIPPSLWNLYKEMTTDLNLEKSQIPTNGDLTFWADQGVFLINSALTVEKGKPASHLPYWEPFTNQAIQWLSNYKPNLVYILLGGYAKKKRALIANSSAIIEATHPSPLGANQGGFFGSKLFSRTNDVLKKIGMEAVKWHW